MGRAVKAYRETSAIKSLSSVCVNMSWPDDFISRYLFVSWSTPPIINRPPCILKHAECVWCERDAESKTGLVCGGAVGWKYFQSYMSVCLSLYGDSEMQLKTLNH